jgi:tetratricopeptide (TPR) repeat protein
MIRKSCTRLATLLVFALFLGCATTSLKVPVTKPAKVNLSGISKIAIGDIRGPSSADVSDELTSKLFQSGRFTVLDRQHLNSLLKEHDLQYSNLVDKNSTVKLGKLMGSAALIFGRVSQHNYKEETSSYDGKDSKGNYYKNYKRKGKATVALALQVTDLETGSIIAVRNIQKIATKTTSASNERAPNIDQGPLLANARHQAVDEFMKDIAPYTVYEKVKLLTDDSIPELANGVEMAKVGSWADAIEIFESASESFPNNAKPLYNLGVALELTDEFDRALECFDQAYKCEANKLYLLEKAACKRRKFEKKKLIEQMKSSTI